MKDFASCIRPVVAACLLLAGAAHAATPLDGIRDPGFGTNGLATASFNLSIDYADHTDGMAVSPSGRIYIAATIGVVTQGVSRLRPGLARFFADGQLDPAFSGDGLASPIPAALAAQNVWAHGVLVRADGKPMVYGIRYPGGGARPKFVVCRYAVAGNLDPTFDADGCAEPTLALIDDGEENPHTAIVLPDDRLLLGGKAGVNPVNPDHLDALVVMLNADGTLAGGFGNSGYILLRPPGATYSEIVKLARLADGRFIAIGFSDLSMFAVRLSSTGQLDTQFGANGYALVSFSNLHNLQQTLDWARSGAVDSLGRIYLCGHITYGNHSFQSVMAFARLGVNGQLDQGFSGDGRIVRPFIDVFPTSNVADCSVDAQDRLVVALQTGTVAPLSNDFGVLRLLPDGSDDLSFNGIGQVRIPVDLGGEGVGYDTTAALALVGDQVIVAGTSYPIDGGSATGEVHTLVRLGSDRPFANGFEGN